MCDGLRETIAAVRSDGRQRDCRCPAHDDRRASLSLGLGADGQVLLHCHAGCSLGTVLAAAGPATLDEEYWRSYESVRQGVRTVCENMVGSNQLFADMLALKITFYRQKLPAYASVIH